ncbi:MAG: TldD/PmbA family protein [Acidimicrobiales bacterium]
MGDAVSADLLGIGDRIVGWARDGEQVEAVVVHSRDTQVRAYDGEIEQLSSAESSGVGIRVIRDHRQGFAYAGTFDVDVLEETLADARDNAGFGTPDGDLGLAAPDGVPVADLALWRDEAVSYPTEGKVDLALELERAVRAADPRIVGVEEADFVDSLAETAVVTTTGVRSAGRETACYVMTYVMASEGEDTQTGFGFSVGRQPGELDVATAAADAAQRATRMLGAKKPPSGRLTIVLDPWVTAQLLQIIGGTLSGDAVLKGRSPFADRVGESVAAPGFTLIDDPTDVRAFAAAQTDGEGLATRRNRLVEAGVLQGFVHDSYTGRRMGVASTGSAVRGYKSTPRPGCISLALAPGRGTQDELVAGVADGVLVQEVSGLHSGVNPVSGDFSTGADGLRIRDGRVAEPIREFTIASTLQRMLQDLRAVGADLTWLPMGAAGLTVVIDDVTVSGG